MIWNPEVETLARDALEALQLRRLQDVVHKVWERVPLYRRRLEEAGVRPEDVRSLDDLRRLPFTRKEDLREHYPFGLLAEPRERLVRIHASSGTTGGRPTVVGYTREDVEVFAEVNARSLACAGAEPGQMLHNAYGYGLFTGGLGLHYGGERLGLTVIPASGGNASRQVQLLRDFKPHGISCTPSFALHLADACEAQGVDPRSIGLRWGILGAEPWSESMRAEIEQRFGMDAVDIYGLSEVIGPGVACECREAKDGLHVFEDHFLVEVVDPRTGEPLPPGETGELVFTTLTRQASPVIRYRTGDIASLHEEPCPCGRTLRRMSRVKGRTDDMLVVRGVNLFPSEIEQALLRVDGLAPHYRVVVETVGHRQEFAVEVEVAEELAARLGLGAAEPAGEGSGGRVPDLAALATRASDALRDALGVRLPVRLLPPRAIPRSEGKAVRVVRR